ncbi:Protein of unknown function [Dyadobacter soli]|uniref:DUF3455 domain-containing protein n=1 Tax=Dyadobacter soli TaxID=659014 RepID=A0A1G6VM27_9BACT|nr:DUF3455 domain-containing protein [Dyadobacter soli]SDD54690.1 Protein of unknown function [Dyadobacter soli]
MYKVFCLCKTAIFAAAFAANFLMACTDHGEPDPLSPAEHISQALALPIPAQVALPANPYGHTRVAAYFAKGIQKYRSQVKANSNPITYEWAFVAPQADLFDNSNAKIGTHFAGPSWSVIASDALIVAQQFTPPKTANVDAGSVDWLLLMPKTGTTPTGRFEGVDYIQRIATAGGRAPSTPPNEAGETIEVPYTAVYIFSKIAY